MAAQTVAVFVAVLALTAVIGATTVSNCLGRNKKSMLGVELSGCDVAPCILQKNSTLQIEITIRPDREVKQLKHTVLAKVAGISMPFVGVDGTTACDNIYEENRVTKASCPMAAGTTYVYLYQLKVLPIYPSINTIVHWALQDVEQHQDVTCFEVQAKIVKRIIK